MSLDDLATITSLMVCFRSSPGQHWLSECRGRATEQYGADRHVRCHSADLQWPGLHTDGRTHAHQRCHVWVRKLTQYLRRQSRSFEFYIQKWRKKTVAKTRSFSLSFVHCHIQCGAFSRAMWKLQRLEKRSQQEEDETPIPMRKEPIQNNIHYLI